MEGNSVIRNTSAKLVLNKIKALFQSTPLHIENERERKRRSASKEMSAGRLRASRVQTSVFVIDSLRQFKIRNVFIRSPFKSRNWYEKRKIIAHSFHI